MNMNAETELWKKIGSEFEAKLKQDLAGVKMRERRHEGGPVRARGAVKTRGGTQAATEPREFLPVVVVEVPPK